MIKGVVLSDDEQIQCVITIMMGEKRGDKEFLLKSFVKKFSSSA